MWDLCHATSSIGNGGLQSAHSTNIYTVVSSRYHTTGLYILGKKLNDNNLTNDSSLYIS
jgi:hypothetical protein